MGQWIQLTAADGHSLSGYFAKPEGPAKGGLVILQEIFGVNHHIQQVVDDYASLGFVALAPALFDRLQRGFESGYENYGPGRALKDQLDWEQSLLDIQAAMDVVATKAPQGKVAVVGYCFGGSLAWLSAARLNPVAAVCYYGGAIASLLDKAPNCPTMAHFGETDSLIPMTDVIAIEKAHPDVEVILYPAGHGFNCDERSDFNEDCARLAKQRTLQFLSTQFTRQETRIS
jgi:carboxymethylenebutenolidase